MDQRWGKSYKILCNMENRNYVSKCMNSIRKENGKLITDQTEILNETMAFYNYLFSKRNTLDIDLNNLFLEYDIPKLKEEEKIALEGPIKYKVILHCLTKSSNNTNTGCN